MLASEPEPPRNLFMGVERRCWLDIKHLVVLRQPDVVEGPRQHVIHDLCIIGQQRSAPGIEICDASQAGWRRIEDGDLEIRAAALEC